MRRVLYAVAVACLLAVCSARPLAGAGFRAVVSEPGLEAIGHDLLGEINKHLPGLTLPDIQADERVPVIGRVDISVQNIRIPRFHINAIDVKVQAPSDVSVTVTDVTLELDASIRWRKVHWPHLSDHTDMTATPEDISIKTDLEFSAVGGRGHCASRGTGVSISEFKIHFHGHWDSWLYNLVVGLLKNKIRDGLQNAIAHTLSVTVPTKVNQIFMEMPTSVKWFSRNAEVDVNTGITEFDSSTAQFGVSVNMGISNQQAGACPYAPSPLPTVAPSKDYITLLLDESLINCVGWSWYENNAISAWITKESNPKFPLKTSEWGLIIPNLPKHYPDAEMSLFLNQSEALYVNVTATQEGFKLKWGLSIDMNIVQPSLLSSATAMELASVLGALQGASDAQILSALRGNLTEACRLTADVTINVDLFTKPSDATPTLYLNLTQLHVNLGVARSNIGTIDLTLLQVGVNLITPIIVDALDKKLAPGFPLPVLPNLRLVDPEFIYGEGFFGVASSFSMS